ncbi:MAG: DUF5722 domain-containing protein, partial [Alistipes sp.]|nr:DUF5722 domain-containing protein [Alistipes sp.]
MMFKHLASLLWVACCSMVSLSAQSSVSLSVITPDAPKDYTFKEIEAGTYEVSTAPRNAVIQFAPAPEVQAKPEIAVLSFDYFCASGMEFMVVMVNEDRSRIEENMIRIPIAEGWSTFSVDVSEKLARMQNSNDHLSLLIVPNAAKPTTLRLRNPRLRAYTEKEAQQRAEKEAKIAREARLNHDIDIYLHKDQPCKVSEVKVSDQTIEVSGSIKGMAGEVYLCEVPMFGEMTDMEFITEKLLDKPTQFKLKFDRYTTVNGLRYDRLYSRWVLAQKSQKGYLLCSHGHYADQVKALYKLPHEVVATQKGIGGFHAGTFASDVDSLQATSVTVNMWLSFLHLTPKENDIPFEYNGVKYYADRKTIEGFDKTLQFTASKNMIVSAIILVAPERAFTDKTVGKLLEHPDFDPAGIYTMPNMTTLESLNTYAAAIDFLAARYSRPDKKYGRVHHWIAHNEVDAGWVWTNAGVKEPLRFMDIYMKSMRLLYYTARKYNPNAEVLITLTHYWQARHNEYCYPSAQLLELLLDYTDA